MVFNLPIGEDLLAIGTQELLPRQYLEDLHMQLLLCPGLVTACARLVLELSLGAFLAVYFFARRAADGVKNHKGTDVANED